MKRFLILLLSITITIQIFGKQVTVEKAQIVATAFLINQKGTNIKSATQINLTLVAEITPQMQKQWSTQKGANSIT
ncbi:MAG: hypothetical protein NTV31_17515, partial [Bacteroidia bacterium]|nr:hypothetical protein [Bacteroidia bacterium]